LPGGRCTCHGLLVKPWSTMVFLQLSFSDKKNGIVNHGLLATRGT
jgi:hypothetical protein